ncbi:unnamed protein product, partial [Sphagnum compactum]
MGVGLASQEVGLVEVQAKGAFLLVASLEEEEVEEVVALPEQPNRKMQEGVVAPVERGEVEATDLRQDEVVAGVQVLAMGWVFLLLTMSHHWMEEGEGEGEGEEEVAAVKANWELGVNLL